MIELHGENVPFSRQKKHLITTTIIETLLDPELDRNLVATTQPVGVESNAVSIIDLKYLKNTKDITCDELGSWKNIGCHDTWVIVDAMEWPKRVEKPSQLLPVMVVYHTECARSTTSTGKD